MSATEKILEALRPVDPLGEALHSLRMSGAFYCRSELSAPWGIDLPPMENCLMFHIVTAGSGWIRVKGAKDKWLQTGDLALVPHGAGHRLMDAPETKAAPLFDLPRELLSERYEVLCHGGGGAPATMICGAVTFDHPAALRVIELLPRLIVIEASGEPTPQTEWIRDTVRFLMAEAKAMKPGGDTVISRLADILVIQAIRSWLAEHPDARKGWLGSLQDKQIGHAIALIHRDPVRPWTVASLAEAAGMSRSAFAARFQEQVGETPIHYVRRWRMHVALDWMKGERAVPLSEIAERLGYESEAAFNRAFKRCLGMTPGRARRRLAA